MQPRADAAPGRRAAAELAGLLALVLGILAWFADKAFTVDDPLFLWLGARIQAAPLDFFGFDVNWNASQLPMYEITQNPPLAGYWIAGAATLLGWSETALHGAFLVPAAAATLFTWLLARRFCAHPLEASLISLLTPVFLVSSTNVMCDTTMLALWCGSIWCWVSGLDRRSATRLLASAALASLAFLTKYYGIALVPLLLAYGALRERRPGAWCLPLLLPLAAALGYDRLTAALYGEGQLGAAIGYAGEFRSSAAADPLRQALLGLVFTGGCLIPALLHAPLLWSWRVIAAGLLLLAGGVAGWGAIGSAISVDFADPFAANVFQTHRTSWELVVQFLAFALGGVCLLGVAVADPWRRRDADSALLALWVVGTFVFAAFVNWVNNGRSVLPMAPALGILLVRRLDALEGSRRRRIGRGLALAAGAMLGLLVTNADYRWANGVRDTARRLAERHLREGRQTLFVGNWGWQYYLEQAGARAIDGEHWPKAGDRLLVSMNNSDSRLPPADWARLVEQVEVLEPPRLRTMSRFVAGFYAHNVGPLPYAWAPQRPDRYAVWEAKRAFRLRPRPLFELRPEDVDAYRAATD